MDVCGGLKKIQEIPFADLERGPQRPGIKSTRFSSKGPYGPFSFYGPERFLTGGTVRAKPTPFTNTSNGRYGWYGEGALDHS